MWIGCGFCFVEKSVRRDGDWAFCVWGSAVGDCEERGGMVRGWVRCVVGLLGVCGIWGRARGMGIDGGGEGARRAGLGSGITLYASRN